MVNSGELIGATEYVIV